MTRILLISVSIFLIAVSIIGVTVPDSVLKSFLTVNEDFTVFRVITGTILLSFGAFRFLRQPAVRILLAVGGLASLTLGLLGFVTYYILPMDQFIFLVTGIYSVLGFAELKPAEVTYAVPTFRKALPRFADMRFRTSAELLTANKQPTARA